jgi:putative aldouronate transport system substrate-binding protein
MKAFMKQLSLGLTLIILLSLLVTGATPAAEVDTSKEVKIVGYLLGDAPAGMPEVMEQLNVMLKQEINATMEIRYIGWGDFQAKYPLVLAAGEDIDWIYTANWAFYFQEAAKSAFYEVTEEMLQEYMPRHYAALPKHAYKEVMVDGKMYMLPTSTPDRKVPVALIRGDLRKKYGVPEITRFSDIEPYLAAIKENEPEMIPMNLDNTYDIGTPYSTLTNEQGSTHTDVLFATGSGTGLTWALQESTGKLYYVMDEPRLSASKKAAAIMKSWYDKGYINRNVFANKVRSKDSFSQGVSGVGIGNSQDIQANLADAAAKGWEVEIIPMLDAEGNYPADPYINNGVALAATTKNPERTLMALDLIMEEEIFNYLVYFGVEGKNYVIKDGKVDLPEGVAADQNTYPPDAAGFWFTNKDQFLPLATWSDQYVQLREDVKGYLIPHPMTTFAAQTEDIKTEIANLNQAIVQYSQPISVGIVEDIDEAFATLDKNLKAAGVEKVREVLQKQIDAHIAAMQ